MNWDKFSIIDAATRSVACDATQYATDGATRYAIDDATLNASWDFNKTFENLMAEFLANTENNNDKTS